MTAFHAGSPLKAMRTERLLMRASTPSMAEAAIDYQARNTAHFARWDPTRPADHWELEPTRKRLAGEEAAFDAGKTWRFWLSTHDAPERLIGQCTLSDVARGVFQSAMLGYNLDEAHVGTGLMREALAHLLDEAFGPAVSLHRVQASVRPENHRSRRVLEGLGFQREGFSPRYLFIDGAWRDHETFALINPSWGETRPPG
ncbi:GNAT family N-acetyltransferase [Mitsuaria sp. GD03876]|uniref:GNAT family N-acetyltransferase n=1 Tax=Mitsuaria sp. GD03876 TaxID=2975399 RepID=UPI002447FC9B|nr:GNAT family N-acetyltransferase [Mitsuaria sp. GD03876]MDH0867918.1 GNAT family N-acetyltransferase [Mitsuaria sp. GD03876]